MRRPIPKRGDTPVVVRIVYFLVWDRVMPPPLYFFFQQPPSLTFSRLVKMTDVDNSPIVRTFMLHRKINITYFSNDRNKQTVRAGLRAWRKREPGGAVMGWREHAGGLNWPVSPSLLQRCGYANWNPQRKFCSLGLLYSPRAPFFVNIL